MENKIQVAEARVNGDWCNIKTPEGKELSIMISKCPKLKAQIEGKVTPFEIEGKVAEKNGKAYVWDLPEERKAGKGQPRNEKAIIAQSSIGYAVDYLALAGSTKAVTKDDLFQAANDIYNWVCQKGGVQ